LQCASIVVEIWLIYFRRVISGYMCVGGLFFHFRAWYTYASSDTVVIFTLTVVKQFF